MRYIGKDDIDSLFRDTDTAARKRLMLNLHEYADNVQRMFNALNRGTYSQPHKHVTPEKTETMVVLQGTLAFFEFDDEGNVTHAERMGHDYKNFAVDITPGSWHTITALEDKTLVFEVKEGPYDPETDKTFADWAPPEGHETVRRYLSDLLSQLPPNPGD